MKGIKIKFKGEDGKDRELFVEPNTIAYKGYAKDFQTKSSHYIDSMNLEEE